MANIYRGISVNWGNKGTSVTNQTGVFQTKKLSKKADSELIRDGDGLAAAKVYYNPTREATFSYIFTGSNAASSSTVNGLSSIGDIVTVADSNFGAISGSNWLVDDIDSDSTNTAATVINLKLTEYGFTP